MSIPEILEFIRNETQEYARNALICEEYALNEEKKLGFNVVAKTIKNFGDKLDEDLLAKTSRKIFVTSEC